MRKKSQIATILTLIMVVIFLFIAITINIGNVAQEKTMISNAADGAALLLASMLGSLANALRIKLELYHGKSKNCEIDFSLVWAILSLVAAIALTIVSLGAGTPAIVMAAINLALSLTVFGLGMWNALGAEPGVFKQIELKFQNMTLEQRMKEKALQYALFAVVSDPNKICDNNTPYDTSDDISGDPNEADPANPNKKKYGNCIDSVDLDMDGQTTGDCIHYFSKWYNDRLKALPRLGEIVQALYEKIFSHDLVGEKAPHIYVWEDPETWQAKKDEYGFWIDTNGNNQPEPEQGSLRLAVLSDDEHDPAGVVYAHDIYFTDWLEGGSGVGFTPLVQRLQQYGYGLSLDLDDTLTKIRNLKDEIKDFEKELSKLYGATFESRLESFDEWILLFYDGTDTEDWYDRMQNWLNIVEPWIPILETRTEEINECLDKCKGTGPFICGPGGGHVCESHTECDDEGNCWCVPDSWCGCAGGMSGGRLCPSTSPCGPPQETCFTPTGGERRCCESAYNLHYQLCDVGTHSSGSGGPCGSPCVDTYHKCGVDHALNHITREHAIDYLTQFVEDVNVLKQAFETAYNEGQKAKEDPRFYEALYEWDDKVAKGQAGEQKVHHIAYVKLSDNLKPQNDFKVPHIHNYRRWIPAPPPLFVIPLKCAKVEKEKGSFSITVARYDGDVGKAPGSPLKNFWIFKTRKKPAEAEKIVSGYTDPTADPATYVAKAAFVINNGIVSETEGHYGPGETYTKDEIKAWGTKAAQRNKDIYIKRLK